MSAAYDIAKILEDEDLGDLWAGSGWSIHVGQEPAKPDTCITLYDTPGSQPHYADEIEYPGVQVRVRGEGGAGYPTAYSKIRSIKDTLVYHGVWHVPEDENEENGNSNGTGYTVWCEGSEHWLQHDENNRPIFVLNLRTQRSETA